MPLRRFSISALVALGMVAAGAGPCATTGSLGGQGPMKAAPVLPAITPIGHPVSYEPT